MGEDKGMPSMSLDNANAIQRELQYKQKMANLFPDTTDFPPLEVKRRKALISKRNISTDGIIDCSQTTTTNCKYAKVSLETFESNEKINGRGTILRINSNVKRQKAFVSKNNKLAGAPSNCIHTEVSPETSTHLEPDGQSTIVESNPSVHAEIPSSAPNAALLANHFPSIKSPSSPSLSHTYSRRKKKAGSSNSGFVSPQQQHTPNIMHYCKDCEVYCSGALCYELHLRGNKHKVKLQRRGDSSANGKSNRVLCDLCKIYCQDETLLAMHLKGQKHKAKQHGMEHVEEIKDVNGKQFWCELCQVPCMNQETFTLHLNGKKHQKQLYVLEGKKKAEAKYSDMPSFVSPQ